MVNFPLQEGNLSAMEILSVANMVNYFGKPTSIDSIEVTPLLMQKGSTKLALYGLGSCRDERLHRLFRDGKVKFLKPSEDEGSWFSVLVLHQNRLASYMLNSKVFVPVHNICLHVHVPTVNV